MLSALAVMACASFDVGAQTRGMITVPSAPREGGPNDVFDAPVIDVVSGGASEGRTGGGGQSLSRYVGKYPSALFKGVPSLKTRLRRLLGSNYNAFFQRTQTEMPIENDNGSLVVRGCQAHSCGSDEAILVISPDNSLHVAIMSASRFRTWGGVPPELTRAMRQ
jgi:hypothetical protein